MTVLWTFIITTALLLAVDHAFGRYVSDIFAGGLFGFVCGFWLCRWANDL